MDDRHSDFTMSRALKQEDERGLSKLYESEFNKPDLHDRILIFDVVASQTFSGASVELNVGDENRKIEDKAIEGMDINKSTSDENESKIQDCEIASKHANS